MKYIIAIDGGGTKTESVLLDDTGFCHAVDVTGGINALDVGLDCACQRLRDACHRLAAQVPQGAELSAIYGGVAACADYFGESFRRQLDPTLPKCGHVRFEGDGGSLIAAVMGHTDGAGLISGTGSSIYIRSGDKLQLYGGWGYLIDTLGSGYTIGRDAFLASYRSYDGRGPKTVLYDLIARQLGQPPENCVPRIYQGGRPFIASFAGLVFEARRMGDGEADRIFNDAVSALADLVGIADRILNKPFQVVAGGGLFAAFPELFEAVSAASPKNATLVRLTQRPIVGAVVEAAFDVGVVADEAFRQRFLDSYQALKNK